MRSGVFPSNMKTGIIIPIYKNKDRDSIINYRPISILNSLSKILEKAASIRLINHLERNNILADSQYAYRKSRSTELAATKLVNKILNNFDENKITIAVFLDLTRAFDCVNHEILCKKMEYYGIKNSALEWFKSYLAERKQYVSLNGVHSDIKNVNIGIPQGSILGPLLFLIYINDLSQLLRTGDQILFADDVTQYDWDDNFFAALDRINESMILIRDWFLANKLSVNTIKSEAMVFTRRNLIFPLPPVLLADQPLPYNWSFKFLGLILDVKLSWSNHLHRIRSKVSSACGILYSIRSKITRSVAKIIYSSLFLPYLQYCNILWASCTVSKMQSIFICQKRIVRLILKKSRWEPSSPLFKRLKLVKLQDFNKVNSAQFVYKAVNGLIPSPITFAVRAPGPYNLRQNEPLIVPFSRFNQTQRFISIRGPLIWNALPLDIRTSRTLQTFKKRIKSYYIDQYS